MTYLSSITGQCKAPLTFVIHPDDQLGDLALYPEDRDCMIYLTPHIGENFKNIRGQYTVN